MKKSIFLLIILLPCTLWSQYQIKSSVFGGGGTASGGEYVLSGSVFQPHAKKIEGGEYKMNVGFWYRYYQQNVVDEVWVSENYCHSCPNAGKAWYYNAYDNMTPALAFLVLGGTVHTDGVHTNENIDMNDYTFTIGNGDLDITGEVNGDGFIETVGNGFLVRTTNGTETSFPVGFNGKKYEVIVSWSADPNEEKVKVRVNSDNSAALHSASGNLWFIEGPLGKNATLILKFPASLFPSGFPTEKFLLNQGQEGWIEHEYPTDYSVELVDGYYVVTITGVNEF